MRVGRDSLTGRVLESVREKKEIKKEGESELLLFAFYVSDI